MLNKFFETLYNKVFVNIVVGSSATNVYMELCSKTNVLQNTHAIFETTKISSAMIDFIATYTRETPFYYISVLDMSPYQGALPTCDKTRLSIYEDLSASEYKCYDNKWTYYTSKTDLYTIEKTYKDIGVDLIFSPFSIVSHFFKDKIDTHMAMYILIQEGFISIAVFDQKELLFGDHLDMQNSADDDMLMDSNMDDDIDLDLEDGIDLDDIDVDDDMDMIDDFGDIEDLDSIEEIDEFSENKDIEEEFYESDEVLSEGNSEDNFNEDYQRFSLIQASLGHFYKEKKYESKFVENVYIADGVGVTADLKRYLEEEMFLSVYVRHIDLGIEVCELAKMEFNL